MKKTILIVLSLIAFCLCFITVGADSADEVYNVVIKLDGEVISELGQYKAGKNIILPDYPVSDKLPCGYLSADGKLYQAGSTVKADANSKELTLLTIDLRSIAGAAVNTSDGNCGLRFTSTVSKKDYDVLSEYVSELRAGALVLPTDQADKLSEITHRSLRAARVKYCDIICSGWAKEYSDNSIYAWHSSIFGLSSSTLTEYSFVPYISFKNSEGVTVYIYANYEKSNNSRCVYSVAFCAYEDRDAAYKYPTVHGVNSKYDADSLAILKSHIDKQMAIVPAADGNMVGKAPEAVGTPKYYVFPYAATYADGTLTLYSSDGTSAPFDSIEEIVFGNRRYPIGDPNGQSVISLDIGNDFGAIHANQIGYKTNSTKRAIVTDGGNIFWVVNWDTGEIAYAGAVEVGGYEELADEEVSYCDFSALTAPGKYYIIVDLNYNKLSYPFEISDNVYSKANELLIKSFYYTRCGCSVKIPEYGTSHGVCHTGNARVLEFTGKTEQNEDGYFVNSTRETGEIISGNNLRGGWHDAGDYGRYSTWEATAASKLMIAYRLYPELYSDETGIPESSNGIPDILDEVRYTLEWLMKMMREDGAVYHKLTSMQHADFGSTPTGDRNQFYLFPVSVEASGTVAAALSMAYRVYKDIDPKFANLCLEKAKLAFDWAYENSDMGKYPDKDGSGTGIGNSWYVYYELGFAAGSLYMSTGDKKYNDLLPMYISADQIQEVSQVMLAFDYILNEEGRELDQSVINTIKRRLTTYCDNQRELFYGSKYEFTLHTGGYTNQYLVYYSAMFVLDELYNGTDNSKYIEENLNYVLGKNATGYCGLLGMGSQRITNAHLRFDMPGFITGGASRYDALSTRFASYLANETRITADTPALKCYLDEFVYFYLNEPTISHNAYAAIAFGYVCSKN